MNLLKKIKQYFSIEASELKKVPAFSGVPLDILVGVIPHLRFKALKAGQTLFKEGEIDGNIYFMPFGLLKAYTIIKDEKVVTIFFKKNDAITTMPSFFEPGKAWVTVEAVTQCYFIYISYEYYISLFTKSEAIYTAFIDVSRDVLNRHYTKLNQLMFSSAQERYAEFIEEFGPQLPYIPQKDIASYLSITQETLSRLRNKRR